MSALAIKLKTDPKWLSVLSIDGKEWVSLEQFPLLEGPIQVEYNNLQNMVLALDDPDSFITWFTKYSTVLDLSETLELYLSRFTDRGERLYNATILENHYNIGSRPRTMPTQYEPSPQLLTQLRRCDKLSEIPVTNSNAPTNFVKSKVTLSFTCELTHQLLIGQVFDSLQVSERVPFASWNNFYKIAATMSDKVGGMPWKDTLPNAIIIKLLDEADTFYDCILMVKDTGLEWLIIVQNGTENISLFRDTVITALGITIDANRVVSRQVYFGGSFYLPNATFNKLLFPDYILTSPLVRDLVVMDESLKLVRQKESIYLYAFPTHDPNDLTLTAHISVRTDPVELVSIDSDMASAILVKIHKIATISQLNYFAQFLSTLVTDYLRREPEIAREYSTWKITTSEPTRKRVNTLRSHQRDSIKLKYIVPDLFLENYPKLCSNQPTILLNESARVAAQNNGQQIMEFPTNSSNSHLYVCNDPDFPFPGLRENKLANRDKYSCIPCCYSIDQTTKPTSILNTYKNIGTCAPQTPQTSTSSAIITTLKILSPHSYGVLPDSLSNLFSTIYGTIKMHRYGVASTLDSFVRSLVWGLYGNMDSVDTICQKIGAKPNAFIDGAKVWEPLSDLLNINVWVWGNGLLKPTSQSFVQHRYNRNLPYIHIYENFGNESNMRDTPIYELIVVKAPQRPKIIFDTHVDTFLNLARNIWACELNGMSIDPLDIVDTAIPIGATAQLTDTYGYRRAIIYNQNNLVWDKVPSQKYQLPEAAWPKIAGETTNSISHYANFKRNKRMAREILWNAFWLIIANSLSIDNFADHVEIVPNLLWAPTPHLPNPSLVYQDRLHIPEDVIAQLIQTIRRELPTTLPQHIPDYYSFLSDFVTSPTQILTSRFPIKQYEPRNPVLAPPFDFSPRGFFVRLDKLRYATPSTLDKFNEQQGTKLLWSCAPTGTKHGRVGSGEPITCWLLQKDDSMVTNYFTLE